MKSALLEPAGSFVNAFDGRYYRIAKADCLPVFFMNVVTASDLWLFVASNGGLSAGRRAPEQALFPYQTVDKIYDSASTSGAFTALRLGTGPDAALWFPLDPRQPPSADRERNLYKSFEGDRLWLEETQHSLGLRFSSGWSSSEEHGLVRRCRLENLGQKIVSFELVDGLRNVLPACIPLRLQTLSSCLVDAYKTAELVEGCNAAIYALSAGIIDRAIPMEALRASLVWSEGLPKPRRLLSEAQLPTLLSGGSVHEEKERRGGRCAFLQSCQVVLPPGGTLSWTTVADIGLSQGETASRLERLRTGRLAAELESASEAGTRRLRTLVAGADGLHAGGDEMAEAHHFANTLFNLMRSGVFADGYLIDTEDFRKALATRNREVARRHSSLLEALPERLLRDELLARLSAAGDVDLERLALEYLPLSFGRRHGDPSRPWNSFSIRLKDAHGKPLRCYEGNWRDIFQNWEALCLSYPEYLEGIIAKFLNASTLDGYNPYRITESGFDWEVPDPEDPWASIGYWGDHQIPYLLRLLEWSLRFHPGKLKPWLRKPLFSYADVPYRVADYAQIRKNPRETIRFDWDKHRGLLRDADALGTDAKLVRSDKKILHGSLAEKLLITVLGRLANFVPGAGLWMNTQRPEWNDANNALVGYGVSVVTLGHLRRLLVLLSQTLFSELGEAPLPVSQALAAFARRVRSTLEENLGHLNGPDLGDEVRRAMLDELAQAGSDYRAAVYSSPLGGVSGELAPIEIQALLRAALRHVEHSLLANRREDGLYHAYNLIEFRENPPSLSIQRLDLMLEGQVAILGSGLLSPEEASSLLGALRGSRLYREDQRSYLLYPDKRLPGFLNRNRIPAEALATRPLLKSLENDPEKRILRQDSDGTWRFAPDLVNEEELEKTLDRFAKEQGAHEPESGLRAQVLALYEEVFQHRRYTGRSGSMFGYEGLGCIYWHMIAKLLVSASEALQHARLCGSPAAEMLALQCREIREGLGFNKTPAEYGAFPADPYSHTPAQTGAQQPGMTGQVKEELIARLDELGVRIEDGGVRFVRGDLRAADFCTAPRTLRWKGPTGQEQVIELSPGSLAFSLCGTPVIYRREEREAELRIHFADGSETNSKDLALKGSLSQGLFRRDGKIAKLELVRPFL